jgi:hypothetical protein
MKGQCHPFVDGQQSPLWGKGEFSKGSLTSIVEKCPNTVEQGLASAVVGSANSHDSIENREAAARGPIKFGIQVGICCK